MKYLKTMLLAGAASALAISAHAQDGGSISGDTVKIGMVLDMSGAYSSLDGEGSVAAVEMAIEEMGGTVNGAPIELLSADHQTNPISAPTSPASGSIRRMSTSSWAAPIPASASRCRN